jgi:hypothetical protein
VNASTLVILVAAHLGSLARITSSTSVTARSKSVAPRSTAARYDSSDAIDQVRFEHTSFAFGWEYLFGKVGMRQAGYCPPITLDDLSE